jgi:hypothetical protein
MVLQFPNWDGHGSNGKSFSTALFHHFYLKGPDKTMKNLKPLSLYVETKI